MREQLFPYGRLPPLIFISHARDEKSPVREQLVEHLKVLEEAGKIRIWIDLDFKPGDNWNAELQKAIAAAFAAVLLVSRTYLSRSFIQKYELPQLEAEYTKRHLPILPLLLEECLWGEIPIIANSVVWPNEHKRLDEFSDVDLKRVLVEFVTHVREMVGAPGSSAVNVAEVNAPVNQRFLFPLSPIGRDRERDESTVILRASRGLALFGVPGQGKTALARYVAATLISQFSDGVYEVDLQNEQQVGSLPRLIAAAMGATQAPRFYEVLQNKRVLLLLDAFDQVLLNSEPEKIGRALDSLLMALGPESRVIITSQQRIDKAGVITKEVRPLAKNFAFDLFLGLSSATYSEEEQALLRDFVDRDLAGHPLSIKIVARYCSAVRIPAVDLRRLWREKWTEIAKLTPSLDDRTLLASFELSYATLSLGDRLWLLVMSLLPDGVSSSHVKEIWPLWETEIYDSMRTLSDRAFLEKRGDDDLSRLMGPIFRFASEKRRQAFTHAADPLQSRLLEFSNGVDVFVDRYVQLHAPQPTDDDPQKKNEMIRGQFHNIHASLDRRLEPSKDVATLAAAKSVLSLYWAYHNNLSPIDNPMASPVDAIKYLSKAYDVYIANQRGDDGIRCQYYIGNILWLRGNIADAKLYLMDTASNSGKASQIVCDSQRAFAHIEYKEGNIRRAVDLYERVIDLAKSIDHVDCIRRSIVGILDAYRKLEDFKCGTELFENTVLPQIADYQPSIKGNALRAYAYLLAQLGELQRAEEQYKQAIDVFSRVSAFGLAHCRRGLGDVYIKLNRFREASGEFNTAMRLYDEAQKNPSLGVGLVFLGRGRLYFAQEQLEPAIDEFRKGVALFDRSHLNEPYELGVAHELLGDAYVAANKNDLASANYQIAVTTFARMGASRVVDRLKKKTPSVEKEA